MAGARFSAKVTDVDKGYKRLVKQVFGEEKAEVKFGILEAEGNVNHGGKQTVLDIAVIHEFGLGHVPRRSFIADYVDQNATRMYAQAKALMVSVVKGNRTKGQILEILGQRWVGEMQKRISSGISPSLAPQTIKRKGSSTPLIDTGQLRASITYQVKLG